MNKSDLIQAVLSQESLAIVGMAKNTGKTTCLNYILDHVGKEVSCRLALTSIGVDGEAEDVLYNTPKPRIVLPEGTIFLTSETHFKERELEAEILDVSERETALGRLITARVTKPGKVILSGPSETAWLKAEMQKINTQFATNLVIVDGALSRLSLASPAVTESLILTTGASVSRHLPELIRQLRHLCRLIELPVFEDQRGIRKISPISVFSVQKADDLLDSKQPIFVQGVLSERFLNSLSASDKVKGSQVVIQDFTRCFVSSAALNKFSRRGGQLKVLHRAKLLGICTNPTSPDGYKFDPYRLLEAVQQEVGYSVYDICL